MSEEQSPQAPGSSDPYGQAPPPAATQWQPGTAYAAYAEYAARTGVPKPPPPSKAMSIWALVLAVIPAVLTWIVSVVLAVIVLSHSKDGRDHGKGMAIAALIIVPVWIVITIVIIAASVAGTAERDASGTVTKAGDVSVQSLKPGDCISKDLGEEAILTVPVVPCSDPHRQEAYASFTLPAGDFPGQDEVDRLTEGGCLKRFASYVGVPADESDLEIVYLSPWEDSWDIDRGVTCLVSTGSTSTGSLKDSGPSDSSERPEKPGTDV